MYIVCFLLRSDTTKLRASTGEVKQHASSTSRHRHHAVDFSQHSSSPVLRRLPPTSTLHDIAPSGVTADARQTELFGTSINTCLLGSKADVVGVREKHIIRVKNSRKGLKEGGKEGGKEEGKEGKRKSERKKKEKEGTQDKEGKEGKNGKEGKEGKEGREGRKRRKESV